MKDIKNIIANNLITLRKKHSLTQNELAKKLDYSDNTISRWECAEISPSIETLQKISEIYEIPLASLFEENAYEIVEQKHKSERVHKLTITLLFVSLAWFIATIVFAYGEIIFNKNLWIVFIWAVPVSFLIMIPFNEVWGNTLYKCLITSGFLWTCLASFYLQFLEYNLWLIFIIGVPAQLGIITWVFMRRNKIKYNKKKTN